MALAGIVFLYRLGYMHAVEVQYRLDYVSILSIAFPHRELISSDLDLVAHSNSLSHIYRFVKNRPSASVIVLLSTVANTSAPVGYVLVYWINMLQTFGILRQLPIELYPLRTRRSNEMSLSQRWIHFFTILSVQNCQNFVLSRHSDFLFRFAVRVTIR